MLVHLQAINGLNSNVIVFNYHIQKMTPEETKRVKAIYSLRKIELLEKFRREEKNQVEVVNINDFSTKPENYIINTFPGQP